MAFLFFCVVSHITFAAAETITLNVPAGIETKICPAAKWQNLNIVWGGVKDERQTQSLVSVSKKDIEVQNFTTDMPLQNYFDQHVKATLTKCGINFVASAQPHEFVLTIIVEHFGAESNKTLVKASTEAEGRLKLNFDSDYTNVNVNVAYLMGSKTPSFKNKKKLTKIMSDLFVGTISEMIQNGQLDFLGKR